MPGLNRNSVRLTREAHSNVVAARAGLDKDALSRKDVVFLKSFPVAVEITPYPCTRASLLRTSNGLFLLRLSFLGTPFPGGQEPPSGFADRNATESVVRGAKPWVWLAFGNRPPPDSNIAVVPLAHEARDVNVRAREIRSSVEKIEQLPPRHDV